MRHLFPGILAGVIIASAAVAVPFFAANKVGEKAGQAISTALFIYVP